MPSHDKRRNGKHGYDSTKNDNKRYTNPFKNGKGRR